VKRKMIVIPEPKDKLDASTLVDEANGPEGDSLLERW